MSRIRLVPGISGILILLSGSICFGQNAETTRIVPSLERYAGLQQQESPGCQIDIRFLSVTERLYDFIRESAPVCLPSDHPHGPFDGWQQLEPGQQTRIQKSGITSPESEFQLAMLNNEQMTRLVEAVQGDTRSNIMLAPRLLLPAREIGTVSDVMTVRCQAAAAKGPIGLVEVKEGCEVFIRVTPVDDARLQVDVAIDLHEILNRHEIEVLDSGVLSRVPRHRMTSVGCSGIVKRQSEKNQTLVVLPAQFPNSKPSSESPIRKVSQTIGLNRTEAPQNTLVLCVTVVSEHGPEVP